MTTRAGFVALIGEPNAGKSTLLNRMVGAKVSIVTHKVQTTRARIRGVAVSGDSQIVFVDTPSISRASWPALWNGRACSRRMISCTRQIIERREPRRPSRGSDGMRGETFIGARLIRTS